jgi:hypothetical protein
MSNRNYEEELNQVRRLAVSLSNEIDYKNQRLLEMENKYNETTATVCRLVVGLTTEIDSKTRSLLEMEQKYSESSAHVKLMVNEIDKLHAGILLFETCYWSSLLYYSLFIVVMSCIYQSS